MVQVKIATYIIFFGLITHSCDPIKQKSNQTSGINSLKESAVKNQDIKTLKFDILIDADIEIVYEAMIGKEGFEEWTVPFAPNSSFEGRWSKGSEIRFVSVQEDGSIAGMLSRIEENIPNEYVSIEHYGMIQDGRDILIGPEVEALRGSFERYRFFEENGQTRLEIETDIFVEIAEYFEEIWPKALQIVKDRCEGNVMQ